MKQLANLHGQARSLPGARRKATTTLLLAWIAALPNLHAQPLPAACGQLTQSWGPFDYRPDRYIPETTYRSHGALLAIVENAHFTPEIESLRRGKTGELPGGDLSYTLGVFPNHHRALVSISNLALREKSPQPTQTRFSVECYFQRALAFRPDDGLVRMIYANYLRQVNRTDDARTQIDYVAASNPANAFTARNLGLLYLEIKDYGKALDHAHKAQSMGLNIAALKAKLQGAGQWQEPAPMPAPVQEPAASQPK